MNDIYPVKTAFINDKPRLLENIIEVGVSKIVKKKI